MELRVTTKRAPWAQRWPSGVEITEPLQPAGGLRLCFGKAQGSQAARSGRSVEKEDPARVQEDWHYRRGLAYISAHGGNDNPESARQALYVIGKFAARTKATRKTIESGIPENCPVELSFWTI